MTSKIVILIILMVSGTALYAQNSRDTGYPVNQNSQYNPLDEELFGPVVPNSKANARDYRKRKKKREKKRETRLTYDQAVRDFDLRMKAVAKKYKKEAKLARKPQYSNPLYFGHKKPPKKRPLGKRKLCRECGIVH